MKNISGRSAKQGGATLSFPQLGNISFYLIKSNFTSVDKHRQGTLIYNKYVDGNIRAKYCMIEGWQSKKWFNRKNKYFNISLRVPRNYGEEVLHSR